MLCKSKIENLAASSNARFVYNTKQRITFKLLHDTNEVTATSPFKAPEMPCAARLTLAGVTLPSAIWPLNAWRRVLFAVDLLTCLLSSVDGNDVIRQSIYS